MPFGKSEGGVEAGCLRRCPKIGVQGQHSYAEILMLILAIGTSSIPNFLPKLLFRTCLTDSR